MKNFAYISLFFLGIFHYSPVSANLPVVTTSRSETPTLQTIQFVRYATAQRPYIPPNNITQTPGPSPFERSTSMLFAVSMVRSTNSPNRAFEKKLRTSSLTPEDEYELNLHRSGEEEPVAFSQTSNGGIATSYRDAADPSIQRTYLASMEYGNNRVVIRRYDSKKTEFFTVHEIPDFFLPRTPPDIKKDNFNIVAASKGPQVLVSWKNTKDKVLRTSFFNGNDWEDQDFDDDEPIKSLHSSINAAGNIAGVATLHVGAATSTELREKVVCFTLNSTRAFANTKSHSWNVATIGTYRDFDGTQRVRYAAGPSTSWVCFQSDPITARCLSSQNVGKTWSNIGSVNGESFDLATPGSMNEEAYLLSAYRTQGNTNGLGIFHELSPKKVKEFSRSTEPVDPLSFLSNVSLQDISLAANSARHLFSGITANSSFLNTLTSGYFSTFYQPSQATKKLGLSLTQAFTPTGMFTVNNAINSLTQLFENIFAVKPPENTTTVKQITGFVGSPNFNSPKFHTLLTEIEKEGERFFMFEILSSLDAPNALGRITQTSTSIQQKASTFSPVE